MAAAAVVVFGVWAFVPGATRAATSPPVRAAQAQPLASYLNAVSCSSATFCVAVGYASDATTNRARTLIESWNGRRWSLVKSPNAAGSDYDELYALSCESPRFCVAVGRAHRGRTKVYQTLIESWNGSSWTIAHRWVKQAALIAVGGGLSYLEGAQSGHAPTSASAVLEATSTDDYDPQR